MARIRTIKPEFWSSPSMRGADPWARLLFIAMWNWADDTGRGTANVRELAAFAFPDDEDPIAPTAAELPSLLAEVRGRWGVIFYEVSGRRYYAIPTWDDHQRNERRAGSRYPSPDEGAPYDPGPPDQGKRTNGRKVTEVPTRSVGTAVATHGSSGPGTGEQGNRGTGEQGKQNAPRSGTPKRADSDETRTAQAITRTYAERVPLSKFPAILSIVRRALKAGHQPDEVTAGLLRLADERRPVTVDSLRVELEGLPIARRPNAAMDRIEGWQALKDTGTEPHLRALPPSTTRKAHN